MESMYKIILRFMGSFKPKRNPKLDNKYCEETPPFGADAVLPIKRK